MSFLFPAMLAGLAGLSVPVIMHLIARHKFPVLDFPSLRLLEREDRTNVLAMKLVDPLQLLLRLIVLLLLVLAMSRLFLPWFHPAGHTSAPRNMVVVVDQSASMTMEVKNPITPGVISSGGGSTTTLLELAKSRARELLGQVDDASRSAVIGAAAQPETLSALRPGSRDALAVIDNIKPIDGTGAGLVAAVARACDLVRGRREAASQIVVLTDLRSSAIDARNQLDLARIASARDDLGNALRIIFVDVANGAADNMAIVDATVASANGGVKVGDDAHVVATVLNSSAKEGVAKLRLAVGDRKEPLVREIKIAPGGKAVVDMTTRVNRAVRTFAQVSIDPDALALDDTFSVPLNVNDSRRVLVVSGGNEPGPGSRVSSSGSDLLQGGSTSKPATRDAEPETAPMDGATILRFVLNPGRELGLAYGTGIDTTAVTPEALAGQPLSKYDLIVLYDVASLPEPVMKDLDVFVREGKSLLIVASGGVSAAKFNQGLAVASGDRAALSPTQLGNDRDADPAVGITLTTGSEPQAQDLLAPFRDRLQGDISVVRFNKLRQLMGINPSATNMIVGTDGQPLAVEMELGQGKLALLAFGFELDRGNLARTRAFPALISRIVDHLTGRLKSQPQDILTALQPAVLDVSEPSFMLASELELESAAAPAKTQAVADAKPQAAFKPRILPMRDNRTVLLDGLPAGRYLLHKPRPKDDPTQIINYTRYITVQPDARESDMTRADEPQLTVVFGPGVLIHDAARPLDLSVPGGELWSLLVILLAIAYGVEAVVGFILSSRRERERAAGDTGLVNEDVTPRPRSGIPHREGVGA